MKCSVAQILRVGLLIFAESVLFTPCSELYAQFNTDRITAIGRNALYFEDYVLSIQYFNQVIKLKPYLSEPYQLRAIAKIQLGDYPGAERDMETAIRLNPFQPGAYYTRGFIYRHNAQYDRAEADFTKALSFQPANRTYLTLRADVRAQQKNYTGALEDIDFLLQKEPHSPSLLFEKAVISLSMKDTVTAQTCFEMTTRYDTQNPQNWSALGMVHLIQNHDSEAMYALSNAIRLGSTWAGDYINRGIISYHRHDYRAAVADYDQAVEIDPNNAQTYYNRAMLRSELGDYNRAVEDFDRALDLRPDETEMRYQRGVTLMQLRQWQKAIEDFDQLIATYPDFLPAYYLAAQAETSLGHTRQAYEYRYRADEREKKATVAPNTGNSVAQASMVSRNRRKEFSSRTAQEEEDNRSSETFSSEARGAIQNKQVEIINEPNILIGYYGQPLPNRQTNYYHYTIEDINRRQLLAAPLRILLQETALTAEMVATHFESIGQLTARIESLSAQRLGQQSAANMANLCFRRAMEFALVKDYPSAMDDCTRALNALSLLPNESHEEIESLAAFMRANWRYKQLEYQRANGELTDASPLDFEIMMRDYDFCIHHLPDFAFAPYNKANMVCIQRDYEAAIALYTQAIEIDPEFAEAYFNRGLTRIYSAAEDDEKLIQAGLDDISHAGELGIYQAYNILTQLR